MVHKTVWDYPSTYVPRTKSPVLCAAMHPNILLKLISGLWPLSFLPHGHLHAVTVLSDELTDKLQGKFSCLHPNKIHKQNQIYVKRNVIICVPYYFLNWAISLSSVID